MKRIICLVFTIIFLSGTFGISKADTFNFKYLADVDNHWAEEYITSLFEMSVFMGDGKNSRADDKILRGEFIALVTRALYKNVEYDKNGHFNDVSKNDFYFANASVAFEKGLVLGDKNGNFNGEKNITREEIMLIISRVLANKKTSKNVEFNDISKDYKYLSALEKVSAFGIIEGDENGNFNPNQNATRGECAKMIYLALENFGERDNEAEVIAFAKKYADENLTENICGIEKTEAEYKEYIKNYALDCGYSVYKTIKNLVLENYKIKNSIAEVDFSYDITFNSNYDGYEKIREYNGRKTIKAVRRSGKWEVYKTDESLQLKEKINLTWEVYAAVPDYAPEGVNVVSPTWYEIISDDSYGNSEPLYSDNLRTLKITDKSSDDYISYAQKNGYALWCSYRNNFNVKDTEVFLKSDSARKNAIEFLIKELVETRADGINIDFENMNDKYAFSNHVREVALAVREMGLVTSVDINKYDKTGGNWSLCYDRNLLARYCDYVIVMAYDQNGTHSKKSGPVAGLDWTEEVIKTTLSEVNSQKLILGIPFYVRIWQEKDGVVVKTRAVSMDYAKSIAVQNGAESFYDEKTGQNVYKWKDGEYNYIIYMEDETSVTARMSLIEKYSLCGAATWRRGFENSEIWKIIKENL